MRLQHRDHLEPAPPGPSVTAEPRVTPEVGASSSGGPSSFGFATRAVHAGAAPDPSTGSRNVPIHQTTAYVFDDVDHAAALFNLQTFGFIYSRLTNPTVAALEERVASLEGGRGAVACASGHAAQLLAFYTLLDVTLGLHSIILSHTVFNIAFVCAVVRARLKNFDSSIVEASIDLGAGEVRTFFRIVLPVIAPGVLAGALLAFTLSVDEFIIAYFTAGPGSASTTFPMQIYAMIRFGVTPEINAVATIVIGVSFFLVLLSQRLQRSAE